jgi:hypothetical protein
MPYLLFPYLEIAMSIAEILTRVASGELSAEEGQTLLPKQAPKAPAKITFKVSAKGAVSAYGLGRWPTTLYKGQWEALLAETDKLVKFMADHAAELSVKDE